MGEKKNMYSKTFSKLELSAKVANGVCTVCHHESMFVSLTPEIYRCVTCGADCHQHINGIISYLPITTSTRKDITVDV